ncbi:hypothetical protein QBC40DRAFT_73414 [Triangularia verruculosa]|uniref:Uncharacterized protein n=1 Tax=Triangularia verruculosa TaxID=2587418 RepID=A0AAN6XGD1_9PEZI|nr:hypothetical protein QBC40DRAFT_73414 [Triangularia verruculosa]
MSYSREEYYTTIVCVQCGYSCKFACLDAHKSSFACHNSACINHLGRVEVDLPSGVLCARESSSKKPSRHESSSHRRSRSSARHSEEPSSRTRSRSRTTHHYEYAVPQEEPPSRHGSGSSARHPDEPSSHHRSRSSTRHQEPSSHHRSRSSAKYPEEPRRPSGYAPQGHPSSYHYSCDGNADYVTVEPDDTERLRQRFEKMGRDERPRYPPSTSRSQYPPSSSQYQYPPSSSEYQHPPSSSHYQYPHSSSHNRSRSSTRHPEEPHHHSSRSHRGPVYEETEILDAGSSPYVAPGSKRGRQYSRRSSRNYAYGPYDEPPRTPDLPPAPYIYSGTWDPKGNQID